MDQKEFTCQECEAEFTVEHDSIDTPSFCPFCGEKLIFDKSISDFDEDEDLSGC